MTIDFGVVLRFGPPKGQPPQVWMDGLDALLPHLEGQFKSLWMTDHFFWNDAPTYEAFTVMTYLLAHFPNWQVGPMVLGQNYRNPALLAKMAATLQVLSGGRYLYGIGAGWKEDEYRGYGYEFPSAITRIEQTEDTLEITRRLWTEPGPVTYHGRHYQIVDAYCEPRPDPVPPIVIGGKGDRMLLTVAKYADWWNMSDKDFPQYHERLMVLKRRCDEIGRDFADIRKTWFGRVVLGENENDAVTRAERGAAARGIPGYNRQNAFYGTTEEVIQQMRQFVEEAGVTYFMIDVLDIDNADIRRTVQEEILPQVQAATPNVVLV